MKVVSILFFLWYTNIFFAQEIIVPAYERIAHFRLQQQFASVKIALLLEKEITVLKQQEGNAAPFVRYPQWYFILNYFPLLGWQIISIISLFICLFFLYCKRRRNLIFWFFLFCFMMSGIITGTHYLFNRHLRGIVTQKTSLYGAPHENSFIRLQLDPLEEVIIVGEQEKWFQISSRDTLGWIPQKYILPIKVVQ